MPRARPEPPGGVPEPQHPPARPGPTCPSSPASTLCSDRLTGVLSLIHSTSADRVPGTVLGTGQPAGREGPGLSSLESGCIQAPAPSRESAGQGVSRLPQPTASEGVQTAACVCPGPHVLPQRGDFPWACALNVWAWGACAPHACLRHGGLSSPSVASRSS